ncbi:hypothetical protein ACFL2G_03830, partial [Candidatus Omnitrophota bacterium]
MLKNTLSITSITATVLFTVIIASLILTNFGVQKQQAKLSNQRIESIKRMLEIQGAKREIVDSNLAVIYADEQA